MTQLLRLLSYTSLTMLPIFPVAVLLPLLRFELLMLFPYMTVAMPALLVWAATLR